MDRDVTMKYMARFGCIGPRCEDHCCYGWRVDVDEKSYEKLIKVARLTDGPERRRIHAAFGKFENPDGRTRYSINHDKLGACPLLEADGSCHIHGTYGESFLPDVCTIYPRTIHQIGEHLAMTGMVSCPEVARELLLKDDALDLVDFPHERVSRIVRAGGMDPRDLRPYWRLMIDVRELIVGVLTDGAYTLAQRLFLLTWFAKRSATVLTKDKRALSDEERAMIEREIEALSTAAVRAEIARRFDRVEAPALLVLLLARELVRPAGRAVREQFKRLVADVFSTYTRLDELASSTDEAATDTRHIEDVFAAYVARRDRLLARPVAKARFDRYFVHAAVNFWRQHLPLGSPELMTHTLRMLGQMTAQKFLLVSHPRVLAALDQSDELLGAALDESVIEVFYRTGRHIEHSSMLSSLEKSLEQRGLRSMAGAVALIRF